ncbi:aminomethyltransferase family protein [Sulfitobacter sp. LCG007]
MKDTTQTTLPVPLGLIPGPVHDRLQALSRAGGWMDWAGYLSPSVLDTAEFEYFAIRNQATLFDVSPMHKYRIRGPQALAMINRVVTRDVARIADNRVGYVLWCDEEGMVIDDGTLFRFSDTDFRLCCQEPMYSWLCDAAWGFDVEIEDQSHSLAGLSLQGPTSFSLLKDAGFDLADLRPFDLREVAPGLTVSRTGFTGDLGYELWTDWDRAGALWDRLWEAGQTWGIRATGYEALEIARIEAGFMAAGRDFQPVHAATRLHRGRTPLELGFGRLVHWDKGHFNGRRALLAQRGKKQRFTLVRLDIGGFKPAQDALIYAGRREVGHVTSGVWSPTAKRNIALAELRAPWGQTRTKGLKAEIYVNEEGRWERRLVPVTIETKPFFAPPRARATPPGAF